MHVNSVEAYYSGVMSKAFSKREEMIVGALRQLKQATDREIMNFLSFQDSNEVRPRITDLLKKAGILEECGKKHCDQTNKQVRIVRIIPESRQDGQMSLF